MSLRNSSCEADSSQKLRTSFQVFCLKLLRIGCARRVARAFNLLNIVTCNFDSLFEEINYTIFLLFSWDLPYIK